MVKVILWCLLSMACIDMAIGFLIKPPKNNIRSSLSQYFDHGRSIESKIFRRVGGNNDEAEIITKAGWFEPKVENLKETSKQQLYIYGMSFSNHVGKIIAQLDETIDVKMFAGPGAPLNHSYEYYQRHRPHKKGDIVMVGILASSLLRINTLTHMTENFEFPAAHFYPRYYLDSENQLIKKQIDIGSLSELREVMRDETRWDQVKKSLEKDDEYYNSILFSSNFTDNSTFIKLIKRAWAQKYFLEKGRSYHDKKGFKNTGRLIDISQKMIINFVQQVRNDQAIPYVILFNDKGFDDHLYLMLKPILEQYDIPFFSSHFDFPASQLSNFIADGHFTPEVDKLIAIELIKEIKKL